MNNRGTITQLPPPILNVRLLSGDFWQSKSFVLNQY